MIPRSDMRVTASRGKRRKESTNHITHKNIIASNFAKSGGNRCYGAAFEEEVVGCVCGLDRDSPTSGSARIITSSLSIPTALVSLGICRDSWTPTATLWASPLGLRCWASTWCQISSNWLARAGVLHEISLLDLYDLAVNAIDGRDGEQVRLPRSLAGSFETAQMDQLHTCVKSTSGGLAPPPRSRCVCEVLMTSFHALR